MSSRPALGRALIFISVTAASRASNLGRLPAMYSSLVTVSVAYTDNSNKTVIGGLLPVPSAPGGMFCICFV